MHANLPHLSPSSGAFRDMFEGAAAKGGRSRSLAALVGLFVIVATVLSAGPAAAQDGPPTSAAPATTVGEPDAPTTTTLSGVDAAVHCDEIISDDGGHLAGPELDQAAFSVASAGFDLHVRVVTDLPDADQVSTLEAGCGWRDGDQRRPRAVLLFVTPGVDEAALWYGSDLRGTVGARFASIRTEMVAQSYGQSGGARTARLLSGIEQLATAPPTSDPLGCDQLVADPGGQLGDGLSEVEEAAFSLQATGTDVRARVEPTLDGGSIDDRLAQLDRTCLGWQVDGDRAPHLVVVAVSPGSRQTGIWYGAEESDGLAVGWSAIQDRDMNPRFKDADIAGGMAGGLRAIEELRRPSDAIDPSDYYRTADYDYDYDDGAPARPVTTTTTSGSGGEAILWLLLSLGLIGVGMAFSYFSWRSKYDSGETELDFWEHGRQNRGGGRYWGGGGGFGGGGGGGHSRGGGFSGGGGGGGRSGGGGGGGHRSGGGSSSW